MPKKKAESPIKPGNELSYTQAKGGVSEVVTIKPRLTWRERRRKAQQSQRDA